MKIALCFAGQARAFEQGYEYYKRNLLDHYDVDVYIHTWKFPDEDRLEQLYKPVKIQTQVPPLGDFDNKYTNTPDREKYPPRNNYRQFYSMYVCMLTLVFRRFPVLGEVTYCLRTLPNC